MNRLASLGLLVAALLCAGAAPAQTPTVTTAGDTITFPISGAQYATARFKFATGNAQTFEFDTTADGVNWLPSGQGAAYVKRIDTASANPSVVFGSTATVGGNSLSFDISTYGASTWELPLAGNVQAVRIKALSTASNTVTVSTGLPYVPGAPVVATLFDVTSATNSAIDTGTLELGGWVQMLFAFKTPAGGSGAVLPLDDTGANTFFGSIAVGAAATVYGSTQLGAGGSASASQPLPLREHLTTIAVSGLTSHIRVEVSRGR